MNYTNRRRYRDYPTGTDLQEFPYRDNYPCELIPVGKSLLGELREKNLFYFLLLFSARAAAVAAAAAPAAV
jgi:hypothetical protein